MFSISPRLKSLVIQGYRPFGDFSASFDPLEVIVGSNGSGKTSLLEFLSFLRDGMHREIPPEIIPAGSIGQRVFHSPGPEKFSWDIKIELAKDQTVQYKGELIGPVGIPRVISESVRKVLPEGEVSDLYMEHNGGQVFIKTPEETRDIRYNISSPENRLLLSIANNQMIYYKSLCKLHECIRRWRFYNSFNIDRDKIRNPVLIDQEPVLYENAGNLSSVLHYIVTEHHSEFEEIQQFLRSTISGFKELKVKARGAPGQVLAFWQEEGIGDDLTLADLSDGTLHLICWAVLCLQPDLPPLICIDEPELGIHPRALPVLAGLFQKASAHTQILLTTHSSYFLIQFDISQIAIMQKEDNTIKFIKPSDSKLLIEILEDFGKEEIAAMHRSDELESLS